MKPIYAILPLVVAVVLVAGCTTGPDTGNPNIQISGLVDQSGTLITNGGTTNYKVHTIQGTIDNFQSDYLVILIFNGIERYLEISHINGSTYAFDGELVLKSGTNTFVIKVVDAQNTVIYQSGTMTVTANIPVMAVRVVLTWDTDYTDVDMHIWDPDGNHCYYPSAGDSDCGGITGGTLDIDDTDGYGPETFTLSNAQSGQYTIKARYYSAHGVSSSTKATITLTINEGTPVQYGPHTFTQDMANQNDESNDWTAATFSVPGA